MGAKKEIKKRLKMGDSLKWLGFSEVVKIPMALPYIMVTGPRWNCHAVIGAVGPFVVRSSIDIHVETAQKSAKQWTLVIYGESYQTETFLTSRTTPKGKLWQKVNLKNGQYNIGLRYYNCGDEVEFPAVKIDSVDRVSFCSVANEMQQYEAFLRQIQNRRRIFYYCLHYYVYHLIRWKKWLPESFVQREYLPVGNPETSFYYGSLRKGDILQVDFDKGIFDEASVYIAFYNICSFPVSWQRITQTGNFSSRFPCDGHYLIRILSKGEDKTGVSSKKVHCRILARRCTSELN
jgi:hypothetical protein